MELHKIQEILKINDNIRHEIRRFYDETFLIIPDRQVVLELFRVFFIQKYYRNPSSFRLFVQVMAADTYMMLLQDIKQNSLDFDDFFVYSFITNLIDNPSNFDTEILNGIENRAAFFEVMVDYTIYFDKLSVLGKKNVVQSSRDCEDKLTKLCPLYQLDVLNYGLATTVEDFTNYYKDAIENFVLTPDVITKDIVYHMKHLYTFNRENYIDNLKQMSEGFYKWVKIQISMDDLDDKLLENYTKLLEDSSMAEICELSNTNSDFLFHIISNYCEYTVSDGIRVREIYISKESLDDYMKDKLPESLKIKNIQKKK